MVTHCEQQFRPWNLGSCCSSVHDASSDPADKKDTGSAGRPRLGRPYRIPCKQLVQKPDALSEKNPLADKPAAYQEEAYEDGHQPFQNLRREVHRVLAEVELVLPVLEEEELVLPELSSLGLEEALRQPASAPPRTAHP